MFFGSLNALGSVCCDGVCNTPAPDFKGSWWGVVGRTFTRMAEYITDAEMLQPPAEPYYPYPHRKPHPTLSVDLPNLTDDDDVERECFGAACVMMANTTPNVKGGGGEIAWLWLHYVPVGETDLDNAVAAFGTVATSQFTEGQYTAAVGTPNVWLIEDASGDPVVWDDPDYLDVHTSTRKAFVGGSYVGWIDKRIDGGAKNRITYYSAGGATPSTLEWINTAQELSVGEYFTVVDVSRHSFPLALGCYAKDYYFGDSTLQNISRLYEIGDINTSNGRLAKPDVVDDDAWDFAQPDFAISYSECHANGSGHVGRKDTFAPVHATLAERLSHHSTVVLDWEVNGATGLEYDEDTSSWVSKHILFDACLLNYALDQDTLADGYSDWGATLHGHADTSTRRYVAGEVGSGTDDYATVTVEIEGEDVDIPVGWLRLDQAYGYFNAFTLQPREPGFLGVFRDEGSYTVEGVAYRPWIDGETPAALRADPADPRTAGGGYSFIEATSGGSEGAYWAAVRAPRIEESGLTITPHLHIVGVAEGGGASQCWAAVDASADGYRRSVVIGYDNSGPGLAVTATAPCGFYHDSTDGDTLKRGHFGVAGQYDDHHYADYPEFSLIPQVPE